LAKGVRVEEVRRRGVGSGRRPQCRRGPVEPPSGSGFGVKMGPAEPFPPQGTQTPGLPTFRLLFSWLQNASGY